MADFLYGDNLNSGIVNIIKEAKTQILIVSPFIKLHSRIKDEFKFHKENPNLRIRILFGKNETNKSRSFSEEDVTFFKQFADIEIRYDERLHAKYYSNETKGILTSMNLYEFSQNNNIEVGVASSNESFEEDAYKYFSNIFSEAEALLSIQPKFEKKGFIIKSNKYINSITVVDKLTTAVKSTVSNGTDAKPVSKQIFKSTSSKLKTKEQGYCIRTRKRIPLNEKRPLCSSSFTMWAKFKDEEYAEKYDHFTGEESHGKTSMAKPVLHKNWKNFKKALKA